MKLSEYLTKRCGEGTTLTASIEELADTLKVDVRTAWGWVQRGEAPPYAQLIMRVMVEALPEQRRRWFAR